VLAPEWLESFEHSDYQCLEFETCSGAESSNIEGWQILVQLVVALVEHFAAWGEKLVQRMKNQYEA
jgi:hypothetical protein